MNRLTCLLAILIVSACAAFANIAPPKSPQKKTNAKSIDTTLSIQFNNAATEPKLLIPKSYVKQLRAELEQLDDGSDNTAAVTGEGLSRTQTVVSGMFLSLALVFGGIWFVRSGKGSTKTAKALVALATVSAIASTATFVYANAGPPPDASTINPKMFSAGVQSWGYGYGKVKLELQTDSAVTEVVLIVPAPRAKASE